MKKLFLILAALLFPHLVHAQTVANINIPESINLPGSARQLVLNGAGIRTKFIFDIYIGALYLEQKQNLAKAIYQQAGEKRVHMHFLYKEISKEKIISSWSEGFKNNHTGSELAKLQARINQFNTLFPGVRKGDIVNLNFVPGKGTDIIINNKTLGNIKGNDFFTALLKIWLGEHPADYDLRQAMLGKTND